MTGLQFPVSEQPCWMPQGFSNLHFSTSAVQLVGPLSRKDHISWYVLNSINSKAMEERMEICGNTGMHLVHSRGTVDI